MADGAKKVNADGRRIQRGGKKIVCGCCGTCSTFYQASFCNTGCCSEWNYKVYICTHFECIGSSGHPEPLEEGQVIGGEVNGKWYCFRVSTAIVYCNDGTKGCEPLPKGAPILDANNTYCLPDCNQHTCPPNRCYYTGSLCSCSPNLPPGAQIWVECETWHAAQEHSQCPVWAIAIGGIAYCVFVREGGVPTELPDPLPPYSIVIEGAGGGTMSNCCECCGLFVQEECCYVDMVDYTETWNGDCTVTTVYGDHSYCCGSTDSWTVHMSGSYLVEQVTPFGLCPVSLDTWSCSVMPGMSGANGTYHHIQYNGDCSGIAYENDGDFYINRCGWAFGPFGGMGGCQAGCGNQSGSIHVSCSGGSANVVVDNTPCGGQKNTFIASFSISSEEGSCGNNGCAPPPSALDVPQASTIPTPHSVKTERRGCSGCRRRKAV